MYMELGFFVDESGDFDLKSQHSPYYIVTLVIHDKRNIIDKEVELLDKHLFERNMNECAIHSAPLIRNESVYKNNTIEERRACFFQMYNFTRQVPITYKTFSYEKKKFKDKDSIISQMARDLASFIDANYDFFSECKEIKVYYDNGQIEISTILNVGLNCILNNIVLKKVFPDDYKLLQVADFICTMELLKIKNNNNILSKSEKNFLKKKELKTIIKTLETKRFK